MSKIRGLTEVVLLVDDLEKSTEFYREVLGLRTLAGPDKRGAIFLRAGDAEQEIPQQLVLIPRPEGVSPFPTERVERPLHHIGLEITAQEFDTERSRLEQMGYDVSYGEHPYLPLKGLYLDDPDGNQVELIAPR